MDFLFNLVKPTKFVCLALLVCLSLQAEGKSRFVKYRYFIKKGDTVKRILKRFTKKGVKLKSKTPMVMATYKYNKHVKTWKNLHKHVDSITVYVDRKNMSKKKIRKLIKRKRAIPYKKWLVRKKEEKPKKPPRKPPPAPSGFKPSLFYMGSMGDFSQTFETNTGTTEKTINQNSPVSVGLAVNYFVEKSNFSYAGSFYFSSLEAPTTQTGDSIEIPAEIGGNIYFQYNIFPKGLSFFAGGDYESFTTFNSATTNTLNQNNVMYGTLGLGKVFFLDSHSIFIKLSYSITLSTITVPEGGLTAPDTPYSGNKLMAYINYKFSKHWFIHGLYKVHSMTGPDTLTVSRIGGGFGFAFS